MGPALRANSGSSDYAAGLFGSCCNEKEMSLGGSVMWWEQLLEGKEQATHKPTSEAFLVGGSLEHFLHKKNPHKLQNEKVVELTPNLRSLDELVISRHNCPRQPKTSLRN